MHSNLRLLRIAEATTESAVEVEQRTSCRRIPEVFGAKHVEHLRNQLDAAVADLERPRQSDIPREVAVVFAERVPFENDTRRRRPVETDAIRCAGGTLPGELIVGTALLG